MNRTLATAGCALLMPIAAFAQAPRDYSGNCSAASCHDAYARQPVVHGPLTQDACDACHEVQTGEVHKFIFVAEGAELCTECHDEESDAKVTHHPVENGDCTVCHDPHASKLPHLLLGDNEAAVCMECHEEVTEDRTFLHGPVAADACTACHSAHGSDHPALLVAEGAALCTPCHSAWSARRKDDVHVHDALGDGCGGCHDPHGADHKMLLAESPRELCLGCHDDVADLIEDSERVHQPIEDERSCLSCHDAHGSKFEALLSAEPMAVCLSCHDARGASRKGGLKDMAKLLAEAPNHHGPIVDGDCTTCHNPHASDAFRLLTDAYPKGLYATFEEDQYALCFGCHDVEMVEDETTSDATGFRNGEKNLHFVHVNRSVKGRSCRACHDPHAGHNEKFLVDSVPFGRWNIPLNYQPLPKGGSCRPGCHRPYGYNRDTPVVNLPGS